MSTYLKNMVGYKHTQLKNKSFEEIQMLFEKEVKRVNIFVNMDAELVKGSETIESEVDRTVPKLAAGSSKRDAEEELDQESSKRQKTGESSELAEEPRDKEADELSQEELQQMMIIVPEHKEVLEDHQREDENAEDVQMADHLRPMEELLLIPDTRRYEKCIVVPAVLADEFELKTELLEFVSNNYFFGLENDDSHSHIRRFYQITRTLRLNQVPDDVVKLILFPFSLKRAAETWLENEPPNSITTWNDLVSKFLN
ncbi:hypothetical protein Tco_0277356 [Tanacetum coccineum]